VEHLQHFGLTQDPFSNEPDLRFFFESGSHRDAQRRVERGLRQHKGLTLLTGDGGMGKTLLARRILEALEEEVFEATLLVMLPGAADATGILQRFARQLGCEEPATDRAGLLAQIYEHLAIVREDGRHAVLMIDDAQIMTPEVLAELSGLLNLEYEDRRLLSMLFVGSPELDRLVQNDSSIMQRVDVRVCLQPLDMPNASAYLSHRLDAVGGDAAILPPPSTDVLFKFGRGRPRLINTLADNALFEAYLSGRNAIDASDVERAAADLGIGPAPGTTYGQLAAAPTVVSGPSEEIGPPVVAPSLDLDYPVGNLELAPELAAPAAVAPTLDLDQGLEAALEEASAPTAPIASTIVEQVVDALEFEVDPASFTQCPVDPAVPDAAAALTPPFAEAEILEAELTPLDDADGEPIEDAFVELIEE